MNVLGYIALATGILAVVGTVLSLVPAKYWLVRIWDFPRVQVLAAGALSIALMMTAPAPRTMPWLVFAGTVIAAMLYQVALIWRYTPLAPREVQRYEHEDPDRRIGLLVCNVLQSNRDAERLIGVTRAADADVMLFVETDAWWQQRLDTFAESHPHMVHMPLDNTYGMLLYSRLPLSDTAIDFLIESDIPSIQARVQLVCGVDLWLNCVHPRPPAPGESDDSLGRDAELLVVGRRVAKAAIPAVVCGDLNDVAWSRTTRLFQKISRLVDPRKGRGFFSTFHARLPGLRFPLDQVFHSDSFRVVSMKRLPYSGSDHFPICIVLSYEPDAEPEQEAPDARADDHAEATETIVRGVQEAGGSQ